MTEQQPRPLTNDEIIARLTADGIRATACQDCGKVKEVVDDKVIFHYDRTGIAVCSGSNADLLGDVEAVFERLVAPVTEEQSDDECERLGRMAAEEAVERLGFLLEAVEVHDGVNSDSKVLGASGEEFCGCVPCIVREVVLTVWPYACHAQFTDIIEFLTTKADLREEPVPVRKAAQALAEQIIERHAGQQE